jgi:acyl-CoA thioester hydrolase
VTHRHTLRVRYGECDMQGVVFNAHYLAYCDDALTAWMAAALPEAVPYFGSPSPTFDYMVKKAELTWTAPFRFGDVVDLDCSVVRWGTTSFDVRVRGTVDGHERFFADFVQVSVTPGTNTPAAVPDHVKAALSGG